MAWIWTLGKAFRKLSKKETSISLVAFNSIARIVFLPKVKVSFFPEPPWITGIILTWSFLVTLVSRPSLAEESTPLIAIRTFFVSRVGVFSGFNSTSFARRFCIVISSMSSSSSSVEKDFFAPPTNFIWIFYVVNKIYLI